MSGSYHKPNSASISDQEEISSLSSPAAPGYFQLHPETKTTDSKSNMQSQTLEQTQPNSDKPLGHDAHNEEDINARKEQQESQELFDIVENLEHLPLLDANDQQRLETTWHAPAQLRRLLVLGIIRWLVTASLVAIIYGVLYYFSRQPVMDDRRKKAFNVLIIGASLALGLNIVSSLKAMAIDFRWWLLSLHGRPLKQVNLILKLDSLITVAELGWNHAKLSLITLLCALWILLNIAAQVGLAILGITFSVDSQSAIATTRNGTVLTPDLSQIYPQLNSTANSKENLAGEQYSANNFGIISLSYNWDWIDNIPKPETVWTPDSAWYFEADDDKSWRTVVLDYSSDYSVLVYTNRTIDATWSCNSSAVIKGGDGSTQNLTLLLNTSGNTTSKSLPFAGGLDQTTFMTDPNNNDCGSGCSIVEAFEASTTEAWWYTCNITVTNVTNAIKPEHLTGQNFTKMAAMAIALQGYTNPALNTTTQYQYYPASADYGVPALGSHDQIGYQIGQFAIGVVATAVQWNPDIPVAGKEPRQGVALTVEWRYVHLILCLTLGGQIILCIISSLVSNMVVVMDDSHLSISRLLRPIVDRLGHGGSTASCERIVETLTEADRREREDHRERELVYTVVHPEKDRQSHHLILGDHKRLRAFPSGHYD